MECGDLLRDWVKRHKREQTAGQFSYKVQQNVTFWPIIWAPVTIPPGIVFEKIQHLIREWAAGRFTNLALEFGTITQWNVRNYYVRCKTTGMRYYDRLAPPLPFLPFSHWHVNCICIGCGLCFLAMQMRSLWTATEGVCVLLGTETNPTTGGSKK